IEYSASNDKIISTTLSPPILHACFRSRKAASKKYDPLSFGYFSGTHIDWESDTILLNLHNEAIFSAQLSKVNCTDLYQKCKRLIINAGEGKTPAQSFLEGGPVPGGYVEDQLFGYFEVLEEVGVTYLGKTPKGQGNLVVQMASDDVGGPTPRRGSARYELVRYGGSFPSRRLLGQAVGTITKVRVARLKRGKERKMSEEAKMRKKYLVKMKRDQEFERAKEVLDQEYDDSFWEVGDNDDKWEKMEKWAEGVPAGADSWLEDWAAALSDFWAEDMAVDETT
ncbi:hypothetical protein IFR05_016748, partial [Cadophora sp. M221]